MEAMHHSFGRLRAALGPRSRTGRAEWRSTQFECLESREVFSTSPFTIVNHTMGYDSGQFAWLDNQMRAAGHR
jgi:hypothetical protein